MGAAIKVSLGRRILAHDKTRFAITVAGVAFAVLLVLVQVGLFRGLLSKSTTTIDHARADIWITSKGTPNVDFAHHFDDSTLLRVRSVPGVERADNLVVQFMNVQLPTGQEEGCLTYAMEDLTDWGLPWAVEEGDARDLRRGQYVFFDRSAERRFGPFHVGDYREVMGRRFKVIGITREASSFTTTPLCFMDIRRAHEIHDWVRDKTSYILVRARSGANPEELAERIGERVPYNSVYTRSEWADLSRRYWIVATGLGLNMTITVMLGVVVGVVVVAQTLYTSAVEHIAEFGTLKALGASNGDIYAVLSEQAVIAAFAGFAAGCTAFVAMQPVLRKLGLNAVVTPEFTALVLVGTVLLCLGASIFSYRRVSGIDPAMVFRDQ